MEHEDVHSKISTLGAISSETGPQNLMVVVVQQHLKGTTFATCTL